MVLDCTICPVESQRSVYGHLIHAPRWTGSYVEGVAGYFGRALRVSDIDVEHVCVIGCLLSVNNIYRNLRAAFGDVPMGHCALTPPAACRRDCSLREQ